MTHDVMWGKKDESGYNSSYPATAALLNPWSMLKLWLIKLLGIYCLPITRDCQAVLLTFFSLRF